MAKNFRSAQDLALVGKTEQQVEKGLESVANEPAVDETAKNVSGSNANNSNGNTNNSGADNSNANNAPGKKNAHNAPEKENGHNAPEKEEEKGEFLGSAFDGGEILTSRKVMAEPTKGVQVPMPESIYMRMMMYKLRNNVSLKDMLVEATKYWLDAMEKKEKRQRKG